MQEKKSKPIFVVSKAHILLGFVFIIIMTTTTDNI